MTAHIPLYNPAFRLQEKSLMQQRAKLPRSYLYMCESHLGVPEPYEDAVIVAVLFKVNDLPPVPCKTSRSLQRHDEHLQCKTPL